MILLTQLRVDQGLSPAQLAAKAGVGRTTIQRIEEGHGARPSSLRKLADALSTGERPVRASELLRAVPDEAAV